MASSAWCWPPTTAYGFVTRFANLLGNKKTGKALMNLDEGAHVLTPAWVGDSARDRIVVATSAGHVLMFSVAELPELDNGGKGNKLIEIPRPSSARAMPSPAWRWWPKGGRGHPLCRRAQADPGGPTWSSTAAPRRPRQPAAVFQRVERIEASG